MIAIGSMNGEREVGNLPENVDEAQVHLFFKCCIAVVMEKSSEEENPSLTMFIIRERRFTFVEFQTMEMTMSCMALDGINVCGKGVIKVKRPNKYNSALALVQGMFGLPNFHVLWAQLEAKAVMAAQVSVMAAARMHPCCCPCTYMQNQINALLNAALGNEMVPSIPTEGPQAQPDASMLAVMLPTILTKYFQLVCPPMPQCMLLLQVW